VPPGPSLNGQSGPQAAGSLAWTRCVHSHAHAWSGPLAAALQARALCHVMSQRRVMRTRTRLGALSAAPCVCPRPLLCRLATPCRSHACILVRAMPALTVCGNDASRPQEPACLRACHLAMPLRACAHLRLPRVQGCKTTFRSEVMSFPHCSRMHCSLIL
jgi:hypothetical protein